jgi:hypothetical protein
MEEDEMYGVVPLFCRSCCARDINAMSVLPIWGEYEAQATMALQLSVSLTCILSSNLNPLT